MCYEPQDHASHAGENFSLPVAVSSTALASCAQMLSQRFDAARGGFGGAPKFPRPCEINALLAQHLAAAAARDKDGAGNASHVVCTLPVPCLRGVANCGSQVSLPGGQSWIVML